MKMVEKLQLIIVLQAELQSTKVRSDSVQGMEKISRKIKCFEFRSTGRKECVSPINRGTDENWTWVTT